MTQIPCVLVVPQADAFLDLGWDGPGGDQLAEGVDAAMMRDEADHGCAPVVLAVVNGDESPRRTGRTPLNVRTLGGGLIGP